MPTRIYETEEGDTLWFVSFVALGTAARWEELRDLNGLTMGPDETLEEGTALRLPPPR